MGSPMGPPMANTFMCKIEKELERENKLAMFYKRFVEDSLSVLPDPVAASEFMATLNKLESSTVDFTMDLEEAASFPLSEWMLSGMVAALTQRCTENRRTEGFCYTTPVTLTPDTNGHCWTPCPVYTRMKLRSGKTSHLLWANNAWCIHFSASCAMPATRADTYTNELKNTKDRQSETTSESSTTWSQKASHRVFES